MHAHTRGHGNTGEHTGGKRLNFNPQTQTHTKLACIQFKPKLSAVLAVLQGISVGAAYIVSQGDITVTLVWFAISSGVTAGLSYHGEK